MTTPSPAHPPRDVDLDAVRKSADSNPVRKAANLVILTLWQHEIEHAVITNAAGKIRVEVQGEVLTDEGWSHVTFKDLHLRLSSMDRPRPKWLRMIMRSRLPWQWVEFVEYRIWLRRHREGRIELHINDVPCEIRFRAVNAGRIDLDLNELPASPGSKEREHPDN